MTRMIIFALLFIRALAHKSNPMQQQDVIDLMLSSKSEAEWNDNCDKVKAEFGGYPDFWYVTIILDGILGQSKSLNNW